MSNEQPEYPVAVRRRSTAGRGSSRSIRCPDPIWDRARIRAESEGYTVSYVLAKFAEGYSKGLIDMPQEVFTSPRWSES